MVARTLRRVLVANRGEIARRVILGAHDAGLEAVAVFAAGDATSPYVGEADAAVALAGGSVAETYLNADALLAAAELAGADCLHPGYGFLSEDPRLATACGEAGIVWVGPTPEAMGVMGHKARAKETVAAAGVAVLPSAVLHEQMSEAELTAAAATIGFPLLVKASAGGGGRGMRLVGSESELAGAVAAARREAVAAFGSGEVFLERFLRSPRHVEVQVLGDRHGNVVHLFDRECSVQRRHQKVLEEAPAVLVDPGTRERMWHAATLAAAAVRYEGAGTVEFLVDGTEYFFLEMNTRLQVEHGVTELVTGLDLLGLQFTVAAGLPLPFSQDEVTSSGHAVEVRLCAERPAEDYRPTPGTAGWVQWPRGPGIRVDAAIESHSVVSSTYDSLVAKVMAHGPRRAAAIARLALALRRVEIDGLETNRLMLAAVLDDGAFAAGTIGVDYLDSRPDLRAARLGDDARCRHAAAAGFALLDQRSERSLVPVPAAGWRNVAARRVDELTDTEGTLAVRVPAPDRPAQLERDGAWVEVGTGSVSGEVVDLTSEGVRRRYRVRLSAHSAEVNGPEGQSSFSCRDQDDPADSGGRAGECRAPLPGTIAKVLVAAGDTVAEGDGLVVLEAMKMEHTLRAGGPGTVSDVLCAAGQQVDAGDLLVAVEAQSSAAPALLRVANCSGFFGDRLSAAREMVEGGPIDVLTGDWLAELTLYILHKTRERNGGYARTFLRQMEEVLPTCVERGITVVSNAGGLNPEGLAAAVAELARRQGLDISVASVSGDDITGDMAELAADGWPFTNLDTGEPLPAGAPVVTANAYLGARPIADALAAGAQVVVTGRVTDASIIVGPALHAFGWGDEDHDRIAGAVVAGHIIECGAQCCGGNYAFFGEIPNPERIGFPIAELAADGSSVITKHPGTGGAVTVGTVTAQLLYEIGGPRYLSPDAVARFDTISVEAAGPDRVRVAKVAGEPPPPTLKVAANLESGWRNSMTLAISGALVEQKARLAAEAVWAGIPGGRAAYAETEEDLSGDLTGGGMAFLRLAVSGPDEAAVGRAFSGAVVETSLSSYPGTFFTSAPSQAQAVARYWPTTVDAGAVTPRIECDGARVDPTPPRRATASATDVMSQDAPSPPAPPIGADAVEVPLWVLVGGRSGDKGGDANVGLWADSDPVADWLLDSFGVAAFRRALPEAAGFEISRYPLPNLRAVNFVVHGILGWGVASNLRLDTQAKGLAELLRSRPVVVPAGLVSAGKPAERHNHPQRGVAR